MKINRYQENILIFLIAEFMKITDKKKLAKAIPEIRKKVIEAWIDEINNMNNTIEQRAINRGREWKI